MRTLFASKLAERLLHPDPPAESADMVSSDEGLVEGVSSIDLKLTDADLEPVEALQFLTTQAQTLMEAGGACVALLEGEEYRFASGVGCFSEAHGPVPRSSQSLTSLVAISHRAAISNTATDDPRVDSGMVLKFGVRQVVVAPMIVENIVAGVLVVANSNRGWFSDDQAKLLETLAQRGAHLIRSTALLRHIERSATAAKTLHAAAVRKAHHAGILAAAARSLTFNVTPAATYADASRIARESLGADGVEIYIADPITGHLAMPHGEGIGEPVIPLILSTFWNTAGGKAVLTGRPEFRRDLRDFTDEPALQALTANGVASSAILPLMVEGRPQGVLFLRFRKLQEFDEDQEQLLLHFSSLMAVAMHNALLFAELERRASRLRAVTRVQQAISAVMSLGEVYAEIYKAVSSVLDSPCLVLLCYDEHEQVFEPGYVVSDGVPIPNDELPRIPLADGATSQAVRMREPNISARTERGWTGNAHEIPSSRDIAVILSAPIMHNDRVLGVIQAQSYSQEAYDWDDMDLIMLIAGQAGTAIANARLRDEERTHQAHQKTLATALEIMQQPVFILSRDAEIRYANTAAVEEYQYSVEEFLGMKCWELRVLPRVRPGELEEIHESLEESGTWSVERLHRRKDGTEFPALVTLSAIRDANGDRVGEVECVRNLTEERRVAEQLRHSERLVALGELVAGVAHEVNNPLTGISALSQMLVEDLITAEQKESVRMIKREADRAMAITRDLLTFARKRGPRLATVDMNDLVEQTLRLRTYAHRAAQISVEVSSTPNLPRIKGDELQLQQVLMNLITNAEHAMMSVQNRRLEISATGESNRVVIEISDTGIGMSSAIQKRIFEPFFSTKPEGKGTGLGLSVSYGIIQTHGGTITVHSAPGEGTTFRISLPLADTVAAKSHPTLLYHADRTG